METRARSALRIEAFPTPQREADRRAVIDLIGKTPLMDLTHLIDPTRPRAEAEVELHAKLEMSNPGGSVKDRAALAMVLAAEADGSLMPDKRILDATSGNTGIALAMLGAASGYGVTLAIPRNASPERRAILRAYGAELILTDPLEGTDGAQRVAKEVYEAEPDRYVYLDQYNNAANWRAHYQTTAPEIWHQTHGAVTHFIAGLGTTGTFVGTSRRLREFKPTIRCVGVEPDSPLHGLEGLKHLETATVPGIWDATLRNDLVRVSTEEAQNAQRYLARREGLLVGTSSGAALVGALKVARGLDRGVVVTIFPDGGNRYLSDRHWSVGGEEQP